MKITSFFVLLLATVLLSLTGCSVHSEHKPQVNGVVLECPPGTPPDAQCIVDYRGAAHFMGGGRPTALFLKGGTCTERDAHGNTRTVPCGVSTLGVWNNPDRADTILPAAIGATGDVLSARQIRRGQEYSADRQVEASANSAPGLVLINDVKAAGGAALSLSQSKGGDSIAVSQQSTEVGVGVSSSSSGCPSGNCFDPTKK